MEASSPMDVGEDASGPLLALVEGVTVRLRAAGCVFAEAETALLVGEAPDDVVLAAWVARRVAGEPLEQIVGWVEFDGLRVRVAPGVFVPRRRTELMVRLAAAALAPGDVLVDVGCGTGAVAAAVSARVPGLEVCAVDVDPDAVACARLNLPGGHVFEGDLLEPLASLRGRVAVITANMPYVPSAAIALMPPEARDHEHHIALDGGGDGLDVQRRLLRQVRDWLRPGGIVLAEVGVTQLDLATDLMHAAGLTPRVETDEDRDATVVLGTAG